MQFRLILFFLLGMWAFDSNAQERDSSVSKPDRIRYLQDSSIEFTEQMRKKANQIYADGIQELQTNRAIYRQDETVENIKKAVHRSSNFLKKGIDTLEILNELKQIEKWEQIASRGIFSNAGPVQITRNLVTSSILLNELLNRTEKRQEQINEYLSNTRKFRNELDSLMGDSSFLVIPKDSNGIRDYLLKIGILSLEYNPIDSALSKTYNRMRRIEGTAAILRTNLSANVSAMTKYRESLSRHSFNREFNDLWKKPVYNPSFIEVIRFSYGKAVLALYFFSINHAGRIVLVLLTILLVGILLYRLRRQLHSMNALHPEWENQLVLRYPFLSALLICTTVMQFIFSNPPFLFYGFLWAVSSLSLTLIFRKYISHYWFGAWLAMFLLFLLAALDNMILQASWNERMYMLLLNLAGIINAVFILRSSKKEELKIPAILIFVSLVILLESLSIIANLFGRYNLAKNLMTAGFFNCITGLLFLWTIRLVNEALQLAAGAFEQSAFKGVHIDFRKVGRKIPAIFYWLIAFSWLLLFTRNFYGLELLLKPIGNFFTEERQVGEYHFSIYNLFLFVLILGISVILSKLVSFLSEGENSAKAASVAGQRKSGVGSWVLLLRIAVIVIGFLFAVAAAGIPMDRITIILGALGVGIGLGLQGLVSNLVSGLIIAFEKPVTVGDIVDVGTRSGTMKSIGFRSSVISTFEGSDVIIPNGDLLNQPLVNWTMSKGNRRIEILVGVAYQSDLEKIKAVLLDVLDKHKQIQKHPAPLVIVKDFNSSSIDFRLLFWVNQWSNWMSIRSEILMEINEMFEKNKFEIPLPKQELYIRSESPDQDENTTPLNPS